VGISFVAQYFGDKHLSNGFSRFLPDSQTNGLDLSTPVEGVFHANVGSYKLNYYDAKRVCEIHGATLATYNQLHAAWSAGLEYCAYVNHFLLVVFFLYYNFRLLSVFLYIAFHI